MAFALAASVADGPLPIGEIVGTVVILGAIFGEHADEFEGPFTPENGYYTERPVGYVPPEMNSHGSPDNLPDGMGTAAKILVGGRLIYELYDTYDELFNSRDPLKTRQDNTHVEPQRIYPNYRP